MVAWDVNQHYTKHWQGTGLKGQLVAPNKAVALKLKKFLDDIGDDNWRRNLRSGDLGT